MTKHFFTGAFVTAIVLIAGYLVFGNTQGDTPNSKQPGGPVLLTVAGKIGAGNRGSNDAFMDKLFAFYDIAFDKAYTFDQAALEALPQHQATVRASDWPAAHTFEGPLLSDVLSAAGVADASTVRFSALDGYGAELAMKTVNDYPLILALKADSTYLGLGGRGPLWLVFPTQDYPALAQEGDAGWSWATFYIEVE